MQNDTKNTIELSLTTETALQETAKIMAEAMATMSSTLANIEKELRFIAEAVRSVDTKI